MIWHNAETDPPPHRGIYLVFRQENRHLTSRQFYEHHGWQTGDTVLYWTICPPPPPGQEYPFDVVFEESKIGEDRTGDIELHHREERAIHEEMRKIGEPPQPKCEDCGQPLKSDEIEEGMGRCNLCAKANASYQDAHAEDTH